MNLSYLLAYSFHLQTFKVVKTDENMFCIILKYEMQSLEDIERQEESSLGEEYGEEEKQRLLLLGQDLLLLLLDLAGGLHLGEGGG